MNRGIVLLASLALARKGKWCVRPASASAVFCCALAAHAQSAGLVLDIPAGSLQSVLTQFAARAGVSLDFPPELVAGKHSAGVHGTYSVTDALHRLLDGTGLDIKSESEKIYSLVPAASAVIPPKAPPATPPAGTPSAEAVLPAITVTGQAVTDQGYHDEGFAAQTTRSATYTDTPIAQIPQSVQVVTQAVSESQQAQTPLDALTNISGVTIDTSSGEQEVFIRGFLAPIMQDGVSTNASGSANAALQTPIAGIERVEVIKGADAILAGDVAPGGAVNLVRKKPSADPVAEVSEQVGSYGDYLTSVDLGGALTPDKVLTYRFIVSGERAGQTTYGYDGKRNLYIAPSLGFQLGGTSIIVGLEQNVTHAPLGPFTVEGPHGPVALNGPVGNASDHVDFNSTSLYFTLDQKLGQNWTFHSDETYTRTQTQVEENALLDVISFPALSAPIGLFAPIAENVYSYSWQADQRLIGKFTTGPVSQTVMAGLSYQRLWANQAIGVGTPFEAPFGSAPSAEALAGQQSSDGIQYFDNAYIQDQINFNRLHVMASIGRGDAWTDAKGATASQHDWTPSIGVLYQLTGDVSVYINETNTFVPQSALLVGGAAAPPVKGRSVEAGAKFSMLHDRLTITTALFRTAESNTLIGDPNEPGFDLVGAGAVSRGFEMDVTGRVMPGLNVIGNYTYSDFKQAEEAGLSQLAKNQGSLWITYDLQGERLHGWGFGGGVTARSGYLATAETGDTFEVPGQARTDVSVYYRQKRWSATLGVKNVFNRRLFVDYASENFIGLEPGRIILLSGKYDF